MAEDLLIQKVVNGTVENTATKTTTEEVETRGTSNLGKDAFLQLLVAEMQNQDPLEPSTNTEWISQLATFSQLEELQTLSSTAENSQIFSLVGKQVVVTTESTNGGKVTKSGVVDYVTYSGKEAKFSIDGNLYSMENLTSVVGDNYYYEKNKPGLLKKDEKYTFDGNEPQDITFEVNMGNDVAKAENVALMVGNTVLPSDYIILNKDKVIIKSELLQELNAGVYSINVVFDDRNYTTVKDAFSITVFNPHPTETTGENTEGTGKTDVPATDKDNTTGTDKGTSGASSDTGKNENVQNGENKEEYTVDPNNLNMKQGDLYGFDHDAVRALYPELTDREFEEQFGYLFLPPEDEQEGS